MKIVIIDGQGGKMGKSVIEQLKKRFPGLETYAIGTNSIATSAMLKAGATYGATGENPVIVNAQDADIIIGLSELSWLIPFGGDYACHGHSHRHQ